MGNLTNNATNCRINEKALIMQFTEGSDMPKARIKLNSVDQKALDDICSQIKDIAEKADVSFNGPIPLPTQKLRISTRKAPAGSGRESYETWEMRIHKRIIDIGMDERALRLIMRIPIPKDVNVEMEILG